MKLRFDPDAREDLYGIFRWIAQDGVDTARSVVERIVASLSRLELFPELVRVGRARGTREWLVPKLPYLVVYEIDVTLDEVIITPVLHTTRNRD